jgi:hypothetical protein
MRKTRLLCNWQRLNCTLFVDHPKSPKGRSNGLVYVCSYKFLRSLEIAADLYVPRASKELATCVLGNFVFSYEHTRVGQFDSSSSCSPSCEGAACLLVLELADRIGRRGILVSSVVSFLRGEVSENGVYLASPRLNRDVLKIGILRFHLFQHENKASL